MPNMHKLPLAEAKVIVEELIKNLKREQVIELFRHCLTSNGIRCNK